MSDAACFDPLVIKALRAQVEALTRERNQARRALKLSDEALDERTKFYRSLAERLEASRDAADGAAEMRVQGERVAWDAVVEARERGDREWARAEAAEAQVAEWKQAAVSRMRERDAEGKRTEDAYKQVVALEAQVLEQAAKHADCCVDREERDKLQRRVTDLTEGLRRNLPHLQCRACGGRGGEHVSVTAHADDPTIPSLRALLEQP
jgi:hypothetical protein